MQSNKGAAFSDLTGSIVTHGSNGSSEERKQSGGDGSRRRKTSGGKKYYEQRQQHQSMPPTNSSTPKRRGMPTLFSDRILDRGENNDNTLDDDNNNYSSGGGGSRRGNSDDRNNSNGGGGNSMTGSSDGRNNDERGHRDGYSESNRDNQISRDDHGGRQYYTNNSSSSSALEGETSWDDLQDAIRLAMRRSLIVQNNDNNIHHHSDNNHNNIITHINIGNNNNDDDDDDDSSSSSDSGSSDEGTCSTPLYNELMHEAHAIQNRGGRRKNATIIMETRRFRSFFGAGKEVVMHLWDLLVQHNLLPRKGKINHLLWALYFMKVYANESPMCSVLGGSNGAIDPKTMRKWVWNFIQAIEKLGPVVVSVSTHYLFYSLSNSHHIISQFIRLISKAGKIVAVGMTAYSASTAPTSASSKKELLQKATHLYPLNIKGNQHYGMRSASTFWRATWYGFEAPTQLVSTMTSPSFGIVSCIISNRMSVWWQIKVMLVKLRSS